MLINKEIVHDFNMYLLKHTDLSNKLTEKKGISTATMIRFNIGYDPMKKRYTIPIYDDFSECVNLRMYDPDNKAKMISYGKGYGEVRLFPITRITGDTIYFCEGEWDALMLHQHGFNAITCTGGAGAWKNSWARTFFGKDVIIVFDCDDAGRKGAVKVAKKIKEVANSVRIVDLGLEDKEDITDWFFKYEKSALEFEELCQDAKTEDGYKEILLKDSLNADNFNIKLKFNGVIMGKDLSPYIVPSRIKAHCNNTGKKDSKYCAMCPIRDAPIDIKLSYEEHKDLMIKFIKSNDLQVWGYLRHALNIPASKNCPSNYSMEVIDRTNVEEIIIVPEINNERIDENYVQRVAYYFGYDIQANQSHLFRGTTWSDPNSQSGIHLIKHAVGSKDNISKFELTDEIMEQLKIFQPDDPDDLKSIEEKIKDIQKDMTENVTFMLDRENVIMATDLVYHSVLGFKFFGQYVEKGWLECTIVGDTRCGKSKTVERLVRHYRCGEFVTSGENSTRAGLLGGLQQTKRGTWLVTWGKLVMNNKRICILDEADELSKKGILGLLSGVRSSGVAELVQIQSQKAMAKTRIIFITNPMWGRMEEHNFGVEVIREIFKAQQDISRIDFAIGVSEDQVTLKTIHSDLEDNNRENCNAKYTSDMCYNSVMFAWSRKPDNIKFTKQAEKQVLRVAESMADDFCSDIPLVIGAEMRIKVARLAVALATRLYSVDETGENVIVNANHVFAVANFLYKEYNGEVLGYREFSDQRFREKTIGDTSIVELWLEDIKVINLLLDLGQIQVSDFEDIFECEKADAKSFVSKMRKERLIKKKHSFYVKTPGFIRYLKKRKQKLLDKKLF